MFLELNVQTWSFLSLVLSLHRLVAAIENLQRFSLSADPSFRRFHVDISRELKLLSSINFIQGCYQMH